MATQPVEGQLDARLAEFENNLTTRIMAFENSVNTRLTEFENILDAGLAEVRAGQAQTNRRIDRLYYTGVAIGGALLVGMATIIIRSF